MTDTKISDLTAITGANTAADDDFVVVDTSAAQTKRITRDELRVGVLDGPHSSSTSSVALGTNALEDSSATSATAIGVSALKELTTGARNTAVGNQAMRDNTFSSNSTAVGYNALALSNGAQNQAFGAFTLDANTTGVYNAAYGYASLGANVSGTYNVAVGGRNILTSCVSGIGNVAIGGYAALISLDDGDYNVGIGYFAGQDLEGGSNNVLIGRNAGQDIVDADSNVCIGYVSGNDISSGQVNTCVGFNAGNTLSTGSNNTLLGRDATPSAADVDNEITLGSSSVTALRVPGVDFYIDDSDVGIGTNSIDSALHVYKQTNDRSARFQRLSAQHIDITQTSGVNEIKSTGKDFEIGTTDALALKFDTNSVERMRIDSSGNVGIGTSSPSEALTVIGNGVFGDSTTKYNTITINGGHVGDGDNDYGLTVRSFEPAITLLDRSNGAGSGQIRVQSNGAFHLLGDTTNNGTIGHTANTTDFVIAKFEPTAHVFNISGSAAMSIASDGSVTIGGSLSKGSGSFKIDHPLKPDTHHLVHSFVEGPQADNIYRGKAQLVGGQATVNLDDAGRMSEGTFVALNGNVQCFTTNESGWTQVRGTISGNVLTIEAQDATCTDTVSWLVIGERHDQHMLDTEWTDENGRVITEPEKETTLEG